jgi:chromosome partitioning protein
LEAPEAPASPADTDEVDPEEPEAPLSPAAAEEVSPEVAASTEAAPTEDETTPDRAEEEPSASIDEAAESSSDPTTDAIEQSKAPSEPAGADPAVAPTTEPEVRRQETAKHKSKKKSPKSGKSSTPAAKADRPPRIRVQRDLPRIMAVANQKGGVGKTTTTVNLGAALAEIGYRVLVIDLDPQGNATTGLGIERRNFEHSMYDVIMHEHPLEDCIEPTNVKNLFVAPATLDLSGVEIELVPAFSRELRLKRAIDAVSDEFDFVLIDCPPSLGLITINALAAAKEVLVPIQCEYYALEGLSQLRSTLKLVGSNLNNALELSTIVLTMYDNRTRLAADVAADVREHFPEEVCDTVIPRTVRISEAPSFGQPITVFDPQSRGAEAYRDLAKEVSNGAPKRTG